MLKKLFIKYIIGECRHLCCMCKYRNECNDNYEEVSWKILLNRYKYRKTIKRLCLKAYKGGNEEWQK